MLLPAFRPCIAIMFINYPLNQRQAHTGTLKLLLRMEALKNTE